MKMTGRNEKELEGVSLLGNQTNVYKRQMYTGQTMLRKFWKLFPINTLKMIIL